METLKTKPGARFITLRFASILLGSCLAIPVHALAQVSPTQGALPQIPLRRPGSIIQNFSSVKTFNQKSTSGSAHPKATPAVSSQGVVSFDVPNAPCTAYNTDCIYPVAINAQGDITGIYTDPDPSIGQQSFIRYANGTFVKFQYPGSSCCTTAAGINIEGTVTGNYYDANGVEHGFLRSVGGHLTNIDIPGSVQTEPISINDLGDVIGDYQDPRSPTHGFIRHANGSIVKFDGPAATATIPISINLTGTVTGYYYDLSGTHGFVRAASGTFTSFDSSGDPLGTYALGINLFGDVVGLSESFNFIQSAFLRSAHGNLTVINPPNAFNAAANAISPVGTIIGTVYYGDSAGTCPAFVREPSGSFKYFAPANAFFGDGLCIGAAAINDFDVVVGSYLDQNYVQHGFIRLP
jgi:uncharacterized membrane protein